MNAKPLSEAINTVKDPNLRKIYECLHDFDAASVVKTRWRDKNSTSSLSFDFDTTPETVETIAAGLKRLFSLDDPNDIFIEKATQAGSGDGNEWRRMRTLHSSSLCALLHFWNISDHPFTILLNETEITFSNVFFEVKNRVFEKPSNVDVVLTGTSENHNPVVFYLESKFSEYIMNSETGGSKFRKRGLVSSKYFKKEGFNMDALLERLNLEKCKACDESYFFRWRNQCREPKQWLYAEGIKQIIAHYLGVCNEIEQKFDKRGSNQQELAKLERDLKTDLYLGSVIFEFDEKNEEDAFSAKRDRFDSLYSLLASALNDLSQPSRLHVVDHLLTYQDLQKALQLSEKTRQFYYGDRNGRRLP